ncbi:MAG TPA: winged helix-turn-helix domain-containing protein [Pyrinomonadaceae bacterium]|jgi:Tol biopolymer transport system component/DNA-binding winged helix-turn-helix (wHTH) protein
MNLEMRETIKLYEFGEFRLDLERNLLLRSDEIVPLTHKALETLAVLVENSGRIVGKDEIIKRVWQDTFVEEGSLTRNVSTLRKVLGEEPGSNRFIETIPRRGYRFVAQVKAVSAAEAKKELNGGFAENPSEDENALARPRGDFIEYNGAAKNDLPETKYDLRKNEIEPAPPFLTRRRFVFLSLLAVFIAAAAVIYFLILPNWSKLNPSQSSLKTEQELGFTKLTNIGKATEAAISPDGKYVVYVADDIGRQSLWVKQVETGSTVQIADAAEVTYQGLAFSADNNFIYFNLWDRKSVGAIYRIPTLGGVSKKVIHDCMSTLAISPDGKKIAFVRGFAVENDQALIVADIESGDEKIIFRSAQWQAFPAFSPDGNKIAFALGVSPPQEQSYVSVREVSLESGQEKALTDRKWLGISGLVWLRDGNDLILNASEEAHQSFQLWKLNYLSGAAEKITNDSNGLYGAHSMTNDAGVMVALQSDAYVNIWTAPAADLTKASKITSGKYEGPFLSWTPDNRIVYSSRSNGDFDTWIMDEDGGNKKQLTGDKEGEFAPSVTADGAHILFTSNRNGTFHIWQMDIDGRNPKQLTDEDGGWGAVASPAGNWFVYFSTKAGGKENLWKMSLESGESVRLTTLSSYNPAISPDGKMLAYSVWNENAKPQRFEHEIMSLETGSRIRSFELPSTAFRFTGNMLLRWMPDGSGLTFIDHQNGASNISFLPLDGGKPVRLTDFNDSEIFWFDWSRDGRQIVLTRGVLLNDVILIKNLQNLRR